ncbi:5674_t:CDS:2, partial [Ambispora leptoticha]
VLISLCDTINIASLKREGNSAVLIDKKIYYIGGRAESTQTDNAFQLDLSSDFAVDDPNFTNFTQVLGLENMSSPTWTAACLGKDNTIYIFDGTDASQSSLPKINTLYKISLSNDNFLNWVAFSPNQGDTWPSARDGIVPIIDNLSRIFVWGGRNEGQDNKTMYIFEANNWKSYTLANAPNPRSSHSATLLNDGRIIYIGGQNLSSYPEVDFLELIIFDSTKLEWVTQPSTSNIQIKNRAAHSALLHSDSISIIMYGGAYYPTGDIPDFDSVWILNTQTWTWSRPSVPSLSYIIVTESHTAVLYNGYMIIAFGINKNYTEYTSQVKVMDVANLSSLAWVPTYKVRLLSTTTTTGPANPITSNNASTDKTTGTDRKKANLGPILGIVIGGFVLVVTVFIIFYICRRRKSDYFTTNGRHSEYSTHSNNELVSAISNGRHSEYSAHSNNEPVSAIISTVSTT